MSALALVPHPRVRAWRSCPWCHKQVEAPKDGEGYSLACKEGREHWNPNDPKRLRLLTAPEPPVIEA